MVGQTLSHYRIIEKIGEDRYNTRLEALAIVGLDPDVRGLRTYTKQGYESAGEKRKPAYRSLIENVNLGFMDGLNLADERTVSGTEGKEALEKMAETSRAVETNLYRLKDTWAGSDLVGSANTQLRLLR